MDQQNEQEQQWDEQAQPQELEPNEVLSKLAGIPATIAGLGKDLPKEETEQLS